MDLKLCDRGRQVMRSGSSWRLVLGHEWYLNEQDFGPVPDLSGDDDDGPGLRVTPSEPTTPGRRAIERVTTSWCRTREGFKNPAGPVGEIDPFRDALGCSSSDLWRPLGKRAWEALIFLVARIDENSKAVDATGNC